MDYLKEYIEKQLHLKYYELDRRRKKYIEDTYEYQLYLLKQILKQKVNALKNSIRLKLYSLKMLLYNLFGW